MNLRTMVSLNPATADVLGEVPMTDKAGVVHVVEVARKAQPDWQALGLEARIEALRVLADILKKHSRELAELTSREMGQPIALSAFMADRDFEQFQWNLDHAPEFLKTEISYEDDTVINEVVYEPRGVVAAIMAWNFPTGNFVYAATQALIAGNVVILKYSEEIPLFARRMEEICTSAGLPEGVLSFVHGDGSVGALLADQAIDMIAFTGSADTGRKLYAKAAEKFIPALLELGGSSPCIVFPDVDLGAILPSIYGQRFGNCGQFCSNVKRLMVHKDLFASCVDGLAALARKAKLGDPLAPGTEMGPLVAERQVVKLEAQVKDAVDKGAAIVYGGKRPEGRKGSWYEPTILTGVTKAMRVWTEEVFGPVLPIVPFETYDEAIALANDTPYGLTGYVYAKDAVLAGKAVGDIKAGCLGVNGNSTFRAENPFGGVKLSGMGRENGKWGFHEVCQTKTIARGKNA